MSGELQELLVTIGPDGTVDIRIHGVKGPKCLRITQKIEALLGGEVSERVHTDEYHETSESMLDEDRLSRS